MAGILALALVGALLLLPAFATALPPEGEVVDIEEAAVGTEETTDSTITPFDAISFILLRLPTTYTATAIGYLDETTELPATIEIAIPAGSEVIWFGAPTGGSIANDPEFEDFSVRTEGNLDIYTAVLEDRHRVQMEFMLFDEPVAQLEDGSYAVTFEYIPLTDLAALRIMTNLPMGSQAQPNAMAFSGNLVDSVPLESFGLNDEGEPYYGFTFWNAEALQHTGMTITYVPIAGHGTPIDNNVFDGLVVVAISLLVVAAAAVAAVLIVKKRQQAS